MYLIFLLRGGEQRSVFLSINTLNLYFNLTKSKITIAENDGSGVQTLLCQMQKRKNPVSLSRTTKVVSYASWQKIK